MDYEYSSPRRKRPHLDENVMDVDPPTRRPLMPYAPAPLRAPPKPSTSTAPPASSYTFEPRYHAFSPSASTSMSSPRKEREVSESTALVLADSAVDAASLSDRLGAATFEEPASMRQRKPRRRSRSRQRTEEPPASMPPALADPPAPHLSLHQHHYGPSPAREAERSHWWREEAPYVLLGYLQVVFNGALVALALWLVLAFVVTIRDDTVDKLESYSNEIRQESVQCLAAYTMNNCDPATRVPALTASCIGWEQCMNRDPRIIGRARVGAETFAEVLDSFVNAISWKTMLFLFISFTLVVSLTNSAIWSVRHRVQPQIQPIERPPLPHWPASAPAELQHTSSTPVLPPKPPRKKWLGLL